MSEFAELVYSQVTDEWQSTPEINARLGLRKHQNLRNQMRHVYRHLSKYMDYGMVEKRVVPGGPSGRICQWRRSE